jgi:ABC-type polysaccharide/polyol phosphate export permease
MATASDAIRSTRRQVGLATRTREILGYRELLVNLVRKELKVRYKNSVLGFVWSLVNPAVTIGVFYVIFSLVLKNSIPYFVLFLMSGVLIFNMFQNGTAAAVGSVVGNAPLVKKVWFPREILPLASVGATFVDFLLQSSVLVVAFAVMRWRVGWGYLPLIPIAIVVALLFTAACGIWLAAVNVKYRDIQHFLAIALMVWFWGTPIIYPFQQVAHKLSSRGLSWLPLLNPYAIICLSFQRALYNRTQVKTGVDATHHAVYTPMLPDHGYLWYLGLLGLVGAISVVLLVGAMRIFRRLEGDFAEAL